MSPLASSEKMGTSREVSGLKAGGRFRTFVLVLRLRFRLRGTVGGEAGDTLKKFTPKMERSPKREHVTRDTRRASGS